MSAVVSSPTVQYGWEKDKGEYEMPGRCFNCGLNATIRYRKGHRARPVVCPECGCRELTPRAVS